MTSASRITIDTTAVSTVSYPMAHNRIAVLGPIRIGGAGRTVAGASVTVTLQDALGVLGSGAALVDLPAAGSTVLTSPPSPLDPAAMARVQEQQDGSLQVSVTIDGQMVAERSFPVTILAAQQWVARPPMLGLEMLAAFVMPNDPAIGTLARRAGDLLAAGVAPAEPGRPQDRSAPRATRSGPIASPTRCSRPWRRRTSGRPRRHSRPPTGATRATWCAPRMRF